MAACNRSAAAAGGSDTRVGGEYGRGYGIAVMIPRRLLHRLRFWRGWGRELPAEIDRRLRPLEEAVSARSAPTETDCVAGHAGPELRNVRRKCRFERSHRFARIQPNSGFGDYSRLSCGAGGYALGNAARLVRCRTVVFRAVESARPSTLS